MTTWNPEYGRAHRTRKRLGIDSTYIATLSWAERLERKIARSVHPDGCWEWTGSRDWRGYGIAQAGKGHSTTAHRDVYVHLVGPIPDGLELDHLCRNRACVNPAHMEVVTHRENSRRAGLWRRRASCGRGHAKELGRPCRECARDRAARYRERRRVSA